MADFSEDESDPEMAEDLEDDVPELEELEEILEELFESEESEENATLTEPAEDEPLFDLEVEPVSMNEDVCFQCQKSVCHVHSQKICSTCLQDLPLCAI